MKDAVLDVLRLNGRRKGLKSRLFGNK